MNKNNIQKIGQIAVPVKNLENAMQFYQDILGLPLLFNTDTMAFFDCNEQRLLLSLPEKEEFATASSILYFQVKDIQATVKDLAAKGVAFLDEPHIVAKMKGIETWMTFFKDTEGNTHAFMSEVQIS